MPAMTLRVPSTKAPWISGAIAVINWAALSAPVAFQDTSSGGADGSLVLIWGAYGLVALAASVLVITGHPDAAALLMFPLVFFTVFSPYFIGLAMAPGTLATLVMTLRAVVRSE